MLYLSFICITQLGHAFHLISISSINIYKRIRHSLYYLLSNLYISNYHFVIIRRTNKVIFQVVPKNVLSLAKQNTFLRNPKNSDHIGGVGGCSGYLTLHAFKKPWYMMFHGNGSQLGKLEHPEGSNLERSSPYFIFSSNTLTLNRSTLILEEKLLQLILI